MWPILSLESQKRHLIQNPEKKRARGNCALIQNACYMNQSLYVVMNHVPIRGRIMYVIIFDSMLTYELCIR